MQTRKALGLVIVFCAAFVLFVYAVKLLLGVTEPDAYAEDLSITVWEKGKPLP